MRRKTTVRLTVMAVVLGLLLLATGVAVGWRFGENAAVARLDDSAISDVDLEVAETLPPDPSASIPAGARAPSAPTGPTLRTPRIAAPTVSVSKSGVPRISTAPTTRSLSNLARRPRTPRLPTTPQAATSAALRQGRSAARRSGGTGAAAVPAGTDAGAIPTEATASGTETPMALDAERVAVEPTPEPSPPTTYAVQVGSFLTDERADLFLEDLGSRGYEGRLVRRPTSDGRILLVVRIGNYESLPEARSAADAFRLREIGTEAVVVPMRPTMDLGSPPAASDAGPAPEAEG